MRARQNDFLLHKSKAASPQSLPTHNVNIGGLTYLWKKIKICSKTNGNSYPPSNKVSPFTDSVLKFELLNLKLIQFYAESHWAKKK